MGFLDWLLGRKPTGAATGVPSRQPTRGTSAALNIQADFLSYSARKFYGPCSKSSNGQYVLAWCDANESGMQGGHRSKGHGQYLLFEDGRVIAEGKMARPNDGKVADNGTFILNDWGFGDGLKGTFCAFDKSGQPLIARKFKANLYNNGLSPDARFAVCQTCNADSTDGATLAIFDLTKRAESTSWSPESGWADFYQFGPDVDTLCLGYRKFGCFRYSLAGEFLDRDAWQNAWLTKGDYSETLVMAERLLQSRGAEPSAELIPKLIQAIDRVSPMVAQADDRSKALALKLLGICLDKQGLLREALEHYDKALAINAKVGIKRRADQIRKSLVASAP